MDPRTYRFARSFDVGADRARVHAVLLDLEHYSGWWPQVLAVGKLDEDRALVVCRSRLPYDLVLELTSRSRDRDVLEVGIAGPIRGWARFRLAPRSGDGQGPGRTSVRFEQEVRAEAPGFVVASYLLRPVLRWNHDRMVDGCVLGLRSVLEDGQASAASAAS